MRMFIKRLQLKIQTAEGPYGTDISFPSGLVIIWADNNMGKSTCVQAIVYGLGLERMLGPSAAIPLPHVMSHYVEDGEREIPVLESFVLLEISNEKGDALTIQRCVKGELDSKLIKTWAGLKLSEPTAQYSATDYFVRDPGAASHEAGFHAMLANFLGWQLPVVPRYNGSEGLLYLECIFPLFFIEQKHGWSGIQSNTPTFLGIRDMAKRAVEFVLSLDAAGVEEAKQKLEAEEIMLRGKWKILAAETIAAAGLINGRAVGLPTSPSSIWPLPVEPGLELYRDSEWVSSVIAIAEDGLALAKLNSRPVESVEVAASDLTLQLENSRSRLAEKEAYVADLFASREAEFGQLNSINVRLAALRDDLVKNQDAAKLRKFGSVTQLSVSTHSCPTCHQHITDTLLPQVGGHQVMSVEENIEFIRNQLGTFEQLAINSSQLVSRKEIELNVVRSEISTLRATVRSIKQVLTSASSAPSAEHIRQVLELEARISTANQASETFNLAMEKFSDLAVQWASLLKRKQGLVKDGLSHQDRLKISAFEAIIKSQLQEFGFSSLKPESLQLSTITYRPAREGFDLGFDLSASDNIRTIWAYINGLLELSAEFELKHPGVLIFDEPRQQSSNQVSFRRLLARASKSIERNHQVIFATSEPLDSFREMCSGLKATMIVFPARVITKQ